MSDYYTRDEVSNSDMNYLLKGFDFYQNYKQNGNTETDAMRVGRLFHSVILEGKGEFFCDQHKLDEIAEREGKKVTRANKEFKEWLKNQNGLALNLDVYNALIYYRDYFENSAIYKADGSLVEEEFYFKYKDIPCRSKLDYVDPKNHVIRDLKTFNQDPDFDNIKRKIYNNSLYRQAQFYKLAYMMRYGVEPEFTFDLISLVKPYKHIEISITSEYFLNMADEEIDIALENFKNKTIINKFEF